MNSAYAVVALLALAGWGATLICMTRGILWMVNANAVAERTDKRIDDRIREMVARIAPRKHKEDDDRSPSTTVLDDAEEALREARRKAQRGGMTIPNELRDLVEPMDTEG